LSKIKILVKNRIFFFELQNFRQNCQFWSKIEIFVKTANFGQKSNSLPKLKTLINNRNFGHKPIFSPCHFVAAYVVLLLNKLVVLNVFIPRRISSPCNFPIFEMPFKTIQNFRCITNFGHTVWPVKKIMGIIVYSPTNQNLI